MPEIKDILQNIGKGLKNSPSVQDMDACDRYFRWMREQQTFLCQRIGEMEADYARKSYESIRDMPEEQFKRIKNSSTLTTIYIDGIYPDLIKYRKWAKEITSLIKQSSDELRTLISFRKEEINSGMATIKQN